MNIHNTRSMLTHGWPIQLNRRKSTFLHNHINCYLLQNWIIQLRTGICRNFVKIYGFKNIVCVQSPLTESTRTEIGPCVTSSIFQSACWRTCNIRHDVVCLQTGVFSAILRYSPMETRPIYWAYTTDSPETQIEYRNLNFKCPMGGGLPCPPTPCPPTFITHLPLCPPTHALPGYMEFFCCVNISMIFPMHLSPRESLNVGKKLITMIWVEELLSSRNVGDKMRGFIPSGGITDNP